MIVEIGSKLFCNYGAMFPTYESVVHSITPCGRFAVINNLDDEDQKVFIGDIKKMGTRTAGGSPIGVFLVEGV